MQIWLHTISLFEMNETKCRTTWSPGTSEHDSRNNQQHQAQHFHHHDDHFLWHNWNWIEHVQVATVLYIYAHHHVCVMVNQWLIHFHLKNWQKKISNTKNTFLLIAWIRIIGCDNSDISPSDADWYLQSFIVALNVTDYLVDGHK